MKLFVLLSFCRQLKVDEFYFDFHIQCTSVALFITSVPGSRLENKKIKIPYLNPRRQRTLENTAVFVSIKLIPTKSHVYDAFYHCYIIYVNL